MAARLGYGGLGNTNGARDFSGKATAETGVLLSGFALALQVGISIALFLFV